LLVVGLVGVSASRSLDLSSTSSSSANRLKALGLVSSLGLNAQSNAHEIVRHLYVYDGDLQNQDVIARRIDQGSALVVTQLRQLAPLATDARTKTDLTQLAGARDAFLRAFTKAVSLSRTETVNHADRAEDRSASRTSYTGEVMPALALFETARSRLAQDFENENRDAETLRRSLAESIDDPGLALVFPREDGTIIDAAGQPVDATGQPVGAAAQAPGVSDTSLAVARVRRSKLSMSAASMSAAGASSWSSEASRGSCSLATASARSKQSTRRHTSQPPVSWA